MKSAKMLGWLPPTGSHFADGGGRRPLSQQRKQAFECGLWSLGHYFYAAIALVACIPSQTKHQGFLNYKVAEAYSLYLFTYLCMKFLYFVRTTLVHADYDSTFSSNTQFFVENAWNFSLNSVKAAKLSNVA